VSIFGDKAADQLKYITTCRLCGKQFTSSPFKVAVIGQNVPPEVIRFVEALQKHLLTHREAIASLQLAIQQYAGYMVTRQFDIQDPQLSRVQEGVRHHLHKMTRKETITDEQITENLLMTPIDDPDLRAGVESLLRDFRDKLQEEGRHAPPKPENSPLVTV